MNINTLIEENNKLEEFNASAIESLKRINDEIAEMKYKMEIPAKSRATSIAIEVVAGQCIPPVPCIPEDETEEERIAKDKHNQKLTNKYIYRTGGDLNREKEKWAKEYAQSKTIK